MSRMQGAWRIVARSFRLTLTAAIAALVVAVVVVPPITGGASLTVLTGSMRPVLQPGDVAVVRGIQPGDVCRDVRIGQIVTYLPKPDDPALITHRVVSKTLGSFQDGTLCRLITQGDDNSAADAPVSPIQVRGVFLFGVPKLGWVRQWASQHVPVVVASGGLLAVGYVLWDRRHTPKPRVAETDTPKRAAADDADQSAYSPGRRQL